MNKVKFLSILIAMFAVTTIATAQTKKTKQSMEVKTQYLEVVRFKLKSEVTKEQFLKAENEIRVG